MTTGLWDATMTETPGAVTPPADLDKYAVVIGCTSAGATSTGLFGPYQSARSMVAGVGYGDTVNTAGQMAEQRQDGPVSVPSVPVAIYRVPATTPGSYGTIDLTGVTGTAVPAVDAADPYVTARCAVKIVTGGTPGTAGIEYQTADDEGPTWGVTRRLGTAFTISVPETGAGFVIDPPAAQVTALVTYANAIRTAALAHFPYTTSSVHGAADTTSDDNVHAAATDTATAILVLSTVTDALVLHFARGSTVHTTADATTSMAAALAAKAVMNASGLAQDAITLALALETALETHENGVQTLSYHGAADAVNVVTATKPTRGTLVAGDIFHVRTIAPAPSVADVDAAYVALSKSGKLFGLVVHEFPADPTMIQHITTGLNVCARTNRRMVALARTRVPDFETAESETAWKTAQETSFPVGTVDDSRVTLWSSYVHEIDGRTSRTYLRAGFGQFCADVIRVPMNVPPACPNDQAAAGLTIWTSGDVQVGHEEGPRGDVTGLSNADLGNRFVTTVSTADPLKGNAVHYTVPWTLAGATDTIKTLPMRRVATSMERAAVSAAIGQGGALLDYDAPDPNVPGDVYRLTSTSRDMLHGVMYGALSERFATMIQNADDGDIETGLMWINPVISVAPGKLVRVEYKIRAQFKGILVTMAGAFETKE